MADRPILETISSELQIMFEGLLGSRNVYYQPPESVKLKYPAIVYFRRPTENRFANNGVYNQFHSFEVTVIDYDPDSEIAHKVSLLPMCSHDAHFTADNLNHDKFTLYR